ncbi:histidine phosphatase superfamily [Geopyxis carbonaria]|nr:histidine phosphatase superfamily [Geopyxis carbonaria]
MLDTIYITRHGFRSNWSTDPHSGEITTTIPSPTGIPSDPALAAHGVAQSHELAAHLRTLDPPVGIIYTSPFYRCLETIAPFADAADLPIVPDAGLGEWYGVARFSHPRPAPAAVLRTFFPRVDTAHVSSIVPSGKGETMAGVHDRAAYALEKLIRDLDARPDAPRAVLIVTHAATNIAAGRALTGDAELDVKTGTCSLGVYKRRGTAAEGELLPALGDEVEVPNVGWRGKGVAGGWECVTNGECGFLSGGEERNWWFQGDEDWDFPLKADGGPGVAAEAGKKEAEAQAEAVAEKKEEAKI